MSGTPDNGGHQQAFTIIPGSLNAQEHHEVGKSWNSVANPNAPGNSQASAAYGPGLGSRAGPPQTEAALNAMSKVTDLVDRPPRDEEDNGSLKIDSTVQKIADEEEGSILGKLRCRTNRMLEDQRFDTAVGVVIVINSFCMGLEVSFEIEHMDTSVFQILERIFLSVYIVELGLRFFAHGWRCLKSAWVMFDFVLVLMGVISMAIINPLFNSMGNDSEGSSMKDSMAGLLVLRMLRLFRLARALRLLVQFKTLWMLIRGLVGSAGTIMYTFSLIMLILYVSSCMVVELITKKSDSYKDDEVRALAEELFPNIPVTMLTLLRFVSLDGISAIYQPLILEDPMLLIFFMPFILVVSISLVNLVTAVIVEGALEQGKSDREAVKIHKSKQFKKLMPELRQIFDELDIDGDGTVTLDELGQCNDQLRRKLENFMQADNLEELFEMIDVDGSGEIEIEEFVQGIEKLVNADQPVEVIRILKQLVVIRKELRELHQGVAEIREADKRRETQLEEMQQTLRRIEEQTSRAFGERHFPETIT